jgi:hypothetical protein
LGNINANSSQLKKDLKIAKTLLSFLKKYEDAFKAIFESGRVIFFKV